MPNKVRATAVIGKSGKSAVGSVIVKGEKIEIKTVNSLEGTRTIKVKKKGKRCGGCSRKKRNA